MPTTGLLRPGRRERRPATALFPISMYTPLDGSTRGNRAKHGCSLDRHAERNPRFSPCRATYRGERASRGFSRPRERVPGADLLSTAKRNPRLASLSTATPREIRGFPPVEPMLPKFSSKIEKKKSSHKVTLVRKLSSRATFLSHRQDKVRAGPYPGFFLSKNLHMQMTLGTKRRVSRRRIFWSQGIS